MGTIQNKNNVPEIPIGDSKVLFKKDTHTSVCMSNYIIIYNSNFSYYIQKHKFNHYSFIYYKKMKQINFRLMMNMGFWDQLITIQILL
jgi:hypothetical protein